MAVLCERPQVRQDRANRRAGDFVVPRVVHLLQIVQE